MEERGRGRGRVRGVGRGGRRGMCRENGSVRKMVRGWEWRGGEQRGVEREGRGGGGEGEGRGEGEGGGRTDEIQ